MSRLLIAMLLMTVGVLIQPSQAALILTITDPVQSVAPGATVSFHGTIQNTGRAPILINAAQGTAPLFNGTPDINRYFSSGFRISEIPDIEVDADSTYTGLILSYTADTFDVNGGETFPPPGVFDLSIARYGPAGAPLPVFSNFAPVEITVAPVPEPASGPLAALSLAAAVCLRRRAARQLRKN